MRQILLFFFLLGYGGFCEAQNLVPNPSFEDTDFCPGGGAILGAKYWYANENTPDYFHECCTYFQFSVPYNIWGYQLPASGVAYVGLCNYSTIGNYREAIGAYLTTPLAIGQRYFVTFKVCLAYNPNQGANVATNNIGILFTTNAFTSESPPRNNFCQVNLTAIVSDTTNWTTVRGAFIADSTYQFISITNFFDINNTDTLHFYSNNWYQAYYYIDDICVSTDSLYTEVWSDLPTPILTGSNIKIYPNPARNKIKISNLPFDCSDIQIYDMNGKCVKSTYAIHYYQAELDIHLLPPGMYSILFKSRYSSQMKTFVKQNL